MLDHSTTLECGCVWQYVCTTPVTGNMMKGRNIRECMAIEAVVKPVPPTLKVDKRARESKTGHGEAEAMISRKSV